MLSGNSSLGTIFRTLRSASLFDLDISQERLQQSVFHFVVVKLLLTLMGLAFYIPVFSPRLDLVGYISVFSCVDLLFLVPYARFATHSIRLAAWLTQVSIVLTTISMTVGIFMTGSYAHPSTLMYFGLIPLTLIVLPFPAMVWSTSSYATLAYLILVVMQVTGLAPSMDVNRVSILNWLAYPVIVILGLWIEAIMIAIYTLNYESRRHEIDQRAYAESTWSTIGRTVVSTQDLDQILTMVIQIINDKMRVETGSILLRDFDTDELFFAKILRGSTEQFKSVRLRVGQGIVGWVVETGKPALVPDVSHDPRWYSNVDQDTGFITQSVLCVPLVVGSEAIGAVELLNKQGRDFNSTDLALLESIAAPVAIAIQNAQLHRRITDQLNDLTQLFSQVEHAKKEWETTVDALDVGIVLTDGQGKILRINHTLARWAKSNSRTMVGQKCWQVVHNLSEPPAYCPHAQMCSGVQQFMEAEYQDAYLGGIFRNTSYPLYDERGAFIGSVSVLKDVTEEKRLQTQLIQSEKLAATGRLAASLAHEINNPLQGIQGCLDLVEIGTAGPEQEQFLAMARKEVERLTKMVHNMLDFNRFSPGVVALVNLQNLTEEVIALSTTTMQKKGIQVKIDWVPDLPPINGVEDQLKQVFLNLVLNAIQAMPNGGVLKIQGKVLEKEDWVTVSISDTGEGIDPADISRVFEPFYTTKVDGTGLGLAVSHGIVTTHGGRLTVDSQVGKGSTFIVWLPIPSAPGGAVGSTNNQLSTGGLE